MNVIAAIQSYVNRMVSESGIKVLLLDAETTAIISMVSTQSMLLTHEVYLIE